MHEEMIKTIAAGQNLSPEQVQFLMENVDGHWHSKELAGSQTTRRGVSCSLWKKAGKERLYFNERIFSKTPRDGRVGYIDCLTGQVVADRGYNRDLAEAVSACLSKENRVNSYGNAHTSNPPAPTIQEINEVEAMMYAESLRRNPPITIEELNEVEAMMYAEHVQSDPSVINFGDVDEDF